MNDMIMMEDVPKNNRPRERLILEGADALSDQELLAILLGSGTRDESVLAMSMRMLKQFDGLRLLRDASVEELTKVRGIGDAKAVLLLAAFELGKRVHRLRFEDRFTIKSPSDCADYMMDEMRFLQQEHFVCLFLNTKNNIIHRQTIFVGGLNSSLVHPREIFKEAIRRSAASIICLHNHPSGDPTPSREDIEVTERLIDCGKLMGIEILDHIIIGEHRFVSLKEKGHI